MSREELIEVMARALYTQEHSCQPPQDMSPPYSPRSKIGLSIAGAEAAVAAMEQAGVVAVPLEPTQEMIAAGFMRNVALGGGKRTPEYTYAAMIEAGRLK